MSSADTLKFNGGKKKNGHKMNCSCHICENMSAKAKRKGYTEDIEREKERKMGKEKINGHKLNCSCPICKNMNNTNKSLKNKKQTKSNSVKALMGGKKSNGHKNDCGCPICKNMKKKKGGKDVNIEDAKDEEYDNALENIKEAKEVIEEENIMHQPEREKELELNVIRGGKRKNKRTLKNKRSNGHKVNCNCPICKNMRKRKHTLKK
jgi:hypothetical protein